MANLTPDIVILPGWNDVDIDRNAQVLNFDAASLNYDNTMFIFHDDTFAHQVVIDAAIYGSYAHVPPTLQPVVPYVLGIKHLALRLRDLPAGVDPNRADIDRLCQNIGYLIHALPRLQTIQLVVPRHMVINQYKVISYRRRRISPVLGFLARDIYRVTSASSILQFDHLYVKGLSVLALAKGHHTNMAAYVTEWDAATFAGYHRFDTNLKGWKLG